MPTGVAEAQCSRMAPEDPEQKDPAQTLSRGQAKSALLSFALHMHCIS